jgi:hypothetical protein
MMKTTMDRQSPAETREVEQVEFVNQLLTVFLNSVFTAVGACLFHSWQILSGFADQVTAVKVWEYSDHDGSKSEFGKPPRAPWRFLHRGRGTVRHGNNIGGLCGLVEKEGLVCRP